MGRPVLLDLFCGAGGAGHGYQLAGFDVIGVDIEPHDAPFKVVVGDWLDAFDELEEIADAVHASPPCQGYTTMSNRYRGAGGKADEWPRLIADVRARLERWGGPYVIENVDGA